MAPTPLSSSPSSSSRPPKELPISGVCNKNLSYSVAGYLAHPTLLVSKLEPTWPFSTVQYPYEQNIPWMATSNVPNGSLSLDAVSSLKGLIRSIEDIEAVRRRSPRLYAMELGSGPDANIQTFHFMGLPMEIRQKIYELVFGSGKTIHLHAVERKVSPGVRSLVACHTVCRIPGWAGHGWACCGLPGFLAVETWPCYKQYGLKMTKCDRPMRVGTLELDRFPIDVLHTCRQIYLESVEILYARHVFDCHDFLDGLAPQTALMIRALNMRAERTPTEIPLSRRKIGDYPIQLDGTWVWTTRHWHAGPKTTLEWEMFGGAVKKRMQVRRIDLRFIR